MSRSWDIFCRVVDNFGDAGVCWRLARQLAAGEGARVRLWIDTLDALHALFPGIHCDLAAQTVAGVDVRRWAEGCDFGAPADIVVEAFGCGLPESHVASMAGRDPRSLWIVLEYLSAEPWVVGHHGLPSPHPRLPLQRYFFFPGVVPGTGGVLKEPALRARRDAFHADDGSRARLWRDLGYPPPHRESIVLSLFAYDNPAVPELLQACTQGHEQVVAVVPGSSVRPRVGAFFGVADPADGATLRRGSLEVRFVPFLPQPRYDELLWSCDWNFVRGEDSLVRAQWALRPLVWQIYPQQEGAHWAKLEAFLEIYCSGLEPAPLQALRALWQGWNGLGSSVGAAWIAVQGHRNRLRRHAGDWAERLARPGDLAGNLARFCEDRLK